MATGGIFQLITNDGKQDRMLMATALLNKRLRLIEQARASDPLIADSTPTLLDIEKTHILFMNAHFKPFAAIGYEYNKQKPQSGSAVLGSEVTFSIPQFGDFFHDMLLRVKLTAPTIARDDNMFMDENTDDNNGTSGRQHAPAFRWCHYPGERLLEKVSFQVNGNPLDEYTHHSYNFWREFCVTKDKEAGWDRCVGQEKCMDGWYRQPGTDLALDANPGNDTGSEWSGLGPESHRICAGVRTGPQTPKLVPDNLELFIPLLFWCNLDPRLAIPSVAIPYGQRFINVKLASSARMYGLVPRGSGTWDSPRGTLTASSQEISLIELYINNIFVNPEVHDNFIRRIGISLIRLQRQQLVIADKASDEILLNNMKWPVEVLFVGMKIDSYDTEKPYNLDRWHKFAKWDNNEYEACGIDCHQENSLILGVALDANDLVSNGPTFANQEYLVVTLDGNDHFAAGTSSDWGDSTLNVGDCVLLGGNLHKVLVLNPGGLAAETAYFHPPSPAISLVDPIVPEAPTAANGFLGANISTLKNCIVEAPTCVRTVDEISINAHGIPLYNQFPSTFFDSYIPYQYGGTNIKTPDDCGPMLVTFNLYPKSYQPSGHINVSRAREFYIRYVSTVIGSVAPLVLGKLVVIASALNFLLISDGSAVLRYST